MEIRLEMTKDEWDVCTNARAMLDYLLGVESRVHDSIVINGPRRASDRKLRLFAVGYSRIMYPNGYWEGKEKSDRAVYDHAERLADGDTSPRKSADYHPYCSGLETPVTGSAVVSAEQTVWFATRASDTLSGAFDGLSVASNVLREVAGNPLAPVVRQWGQSPLKTGVLPVGVVLDRWLTPTVLALAQAVYDNRDPRGVLDNARLLVLSDALEEAGCTKQVLLDHLRVPGEHVYGCWVVDLVLNKK